MILNPPRPESQVKQTPAVVMAPKASHKRRGASSLKNLTAIRAVATPSRLSSKEAEKPEVLASPAIKLIGPRTPPAIVAAASQGKSFFLRDAARLSATPPLRPLPAIFLCKAERPNPTKCAQIEKTRERYRVHFPCQQFG